jgi:hypothetical protein
VKVWITKYWDSRGIVEAEVSPCTEMPNAVWDGKPGQVRCRWTAGDWYESLDEAYEHVMRLRAINIASMEKELKRLPAKIERAKKKPITVRFVTRIEKRQPPPLQGADK